MEGNKNEQLMEETPPTPLTDEQRCVLGIIDIVNQHSASLQELLIVIDRINIRLLNLEHCVKQLKGRNR